MSVFHDDAARISDPMLRRAHELAEKGRGLTSPNPVVGCVIVRDRTIVGEGYHERFGGLHAERNALGAAGSASRGATAFVTLEPCNHHGKTPPCVDGLLEAGIARVVIGMPDPNPLVAGNGARALVDAGVEVEFAEDPAPFHAQNEPWLTWLDRKRPWVRVKVAVTLDGKTALAPQSRSALSGSAASELTMRLRAQADAIAVGAETARVDDPRLTVRDHQGTSSGRQPLRVVISRSGVPDATLFHDGAGPTLAMAHESVPREEAAPQGAELATYPQHGGLSSALGVLADRGVTHLLVEAGGRMLSALWQEALIDELVVYHVGGMAGTSAPSVWELPFAAGMAEAPEHARLRGVEAGVVGDDIVTVWRPCGPSSDA